MKSRIAVLLIALALPSAAHAQGSSPDPLRFDGRWNTTVTCKVSKDPAGATMKFVTEVKDGLLVGHSGADGAQGYLHINGRVTPAGVGQIYARGRTGKEEVIAGRDVPVGTEYNYYIEAKFDTKSGSGNRVEGRGCAFKFEKR